MTMDAIAVERAANAEAWKVFHANQREVLADRSAERRAAIGRAEKAAKAFAEALRDLQAADKDIRHAFVGLGRNPPVLDSERIVSQLFGATMTTVAGHRSRYGDLTWFYSGRYQPNTNWIETLSAGLKPALLELEKEQDDGKRSDEES